MSYTTVEERQREKIIELQERVAELEGARAEEVGRRTLRPLAEYHEDYGDVMWWEVPVVQPPVHVGSPLDDDFPNEDAAAFGWHFTRFMNPLEKAEAAELLDRASTAQAEPQATDTRVPFDEDHYDRTLTRIQDGNKAKREAEQDCGEGAPR